MNQKFHRCDHITFENHTDIHTDGFFQIFCSSKSGVQTKGPQPTSNQTFSELLGRRQTLVNDHRELRVALGQTEAPKMVGHFSRIPSGKLTFFHGKSTISFLVNTINMQDFLWLVTSLPEGTFFGTLLRIYDLLRK